MKKSEKWLCVVAVIVFAGAVLLWRFNEASKLDRLSEKVHFTDGKHKKYYLNGALQGEWSYKGDKLHGEGIEYHLNGKTKYEDFWVNGNIVWRQTYDTNGVLVNTFGKKP